MLSFLFKPKFAIIIRRNEMNYEINAVEMQGQFKICPSCGYKDGFHSMFKKDGEITRWLFICPACHEVFDIGHTV
jgi:hypothetical protein